MREPANDDAELSLTHTDAGGSARMVDVGAKPSTRRVAIATGVITMRAQTLALVRANGIAKGDVLTVARIAGISAAKRTDELIPLCHSIPLSLVEIALELDESVPGIRATATAVTTGPTGVEMEAIIAVSVALATVYDMAKGVDRAMRIDDIHLVEKTGGRSGTYRAADEATAE